jgi:protein ImuB
MRPLDHAPERVLVVWCPDWPEPARDGDQDEGPRARAFEPVVAAVEEFCPRVEVLHPGACAIGARGPARYFGGEQALAAKIADAVARRGFACRVAVADGLFAARLAARAPRPAGKDAAVIVAPGGTPAFLAPYPVGCLGQPDLADLLPRLGLRTLGEFAALPAAEALNRFGADGALAHRLARGLEPRPLVPRPPSADLSASVEFDPPAEQAEPVAFAAKSLAERMHADLAARGLACVRVQVQVTCTDGQEITRLWRHDGLLSSLAVAERVRWQLGGWRAAQEGNRRSVTASGGITMLRLVPDQLVPAAGRQLGLWGDTVVDDRVARAALRVQALLGHGAVTRPLLAGGRDAAEQVTLVPFGDAADPRHPADRPWPGRLPAPSPATVYPAPRPAAVTDEAGAAVTVTGRALMSAPPARLSVGGGPWLAVTSWAGPWPVAERWWRPADSRRRARFQLVAEDGSAWLAAVQDGQWQVEAGYELRAGPRIPGNGLSG